MNAIRTIGLVCRNDRPEAAEVADALTRAAATRGMTTLACGDDAVPADADVVVSVGGDGTMLHAVKLAIRAGLPAFGVNVGHVGYLAEVEPDQIERALDVVAETEPTISRRMTLDVGWVGTGRSAMAVNDVVIEKAETQRTVHVSVDIDGSRLMVYRADGVLVATPTGSTAYSFSAGGPVVQPRLEALVLTPIAPHQLFGRSIVFEPQTVLRLTVERDRPVRVVVDGVDEGLLETGSAVEIRRGSSPAQLIDFGVRRFPHAIRENFGLDDA